MNDDQHAVDIEPGVIILGIISALLLIGLLVWLA